jgi:arylsulfatase A-like enzyme
MPDRRERQRLRSLAGIVSIALGAIGVAAPPDGPRPDVILIGVDTLRADHLGTYGYSRPTSPNIDRFAAESVLFENCITPIPLTTPAVASLFTGRHPARSRVRSLSDDLPAEIPSLASRLREHGYATTSLVATGILRGRLQQGFERVFATRGEMPASRVTDQAIETLRRGRQPHFLFVFYRDPHMAYRPPSVVFDRGYRGPHQEWISFRGGMGRMVFHNPLAPRTREHAIALYDSEIFHLDRELGRLLEHLRAQRPDALVILTADHGEALGERGYYYDHGLLLDQPALHVPLIVHAPGLEPRRVPRTVSLVDVAPTILARVGTLPMAGLDGVDLLGSLGEGSAGESYSESGSPLLPEAIASGMALDASIASRRRAIVSGRWKLVYVPRRGGPVYELYDLVADPGERNDLIRSRDASGLRRRLDAWIARDPQASDAAVVPLAPDEVERLRALGYLE